MQRSTPSLVAAGQIVSDQYRVVSRLGRGGMGEVVLAEQLDSRQTVAIKVLAPQTISPKNLARFVREARVMVRLCSEHVARVLDVGTLESGLPYIVMEHLQGHDFGHLIDALGPFSVEEAATSILQATKALAEAHRLGIVHRDLKPSNLFLTQPHDGQWFVKVLDFGVSKVPEEQGGECITATADVFGTPAYMSPEQTRSAKLVDARTDIWALGLILAECLSGKTVYQGTTDLGILMAIAAEPLPNLHLEGTGTPVELENVIRRCLEKNPADRYQSATELGNALLPFAKAEAVDAKRRFHRIAAARSALDAMTLPQDTRVWRRPVTRRTVRRASWVAAASLAVILGVSLLARPGRTDVSTSGTEREAPAEPGATSPPSEIAPAPSGNPKIAEPSGELKNDGNGSRVLRKARVRARPDGLHDRK